MTTSATGQVLAPTHVGVSKPTGQGREFLKMLLPRRTVRKGDVTLRFNDDLFGNLIKAEKDGAFDSIPLQVADHHTDNPKYTEGQARDFQVLEDGPEGPGLYGKIRFATDEAATMIEKNPQVGVSVRMIQNLTRDEDGQKHAWKAAIKHVLLTTDPHVRGMGGWTATDLDRESLGEVVDLTTTEETGMPEENKGSEGETLDLSREDVQDIKALLADMKELAAGRGPGSEGDGTGGTGSPTSGAVDLQREETTNAIDLMRAEVAIERQARIDLQRDLLNARVERELDTVARSGLAPAIVDLARPLFQLGIGTTESVVDLSRGDGKGGVSVTKLDVGSQVRKLVQTFVDLSNQGLAVIDLDNEDGFYGETDEERSRDKNMADAFDKMFPIN